MSYRHYNRNQNKNQIYNSRNYKCLIDLEHSIVVLQSTIVEIINVLQTRRYYEQYDESTIVEITNVLQTNKYLNDSYLIYNSRNYKCFIDKNNTKFINTIYNSRNYKCLIDGTNSTFAFSIYNSRNYKCLIDIPVATVCRLYLQQQKL